LNNTCVRFNKEGGTNAHPQFRELLKEMPAHRQQRIEQRFQTSLVAMPLDQVRCTLAIGLPARSPIPF